jgi:gliding motility-associated-like protein
LLSCNPALPPFTGTCTTDSVLVPGAHALLINNFVPNYLNCIAPQCPDYLIAFTLKNRDSICGDQCGYLCARGNMWRMTVEACPISGNITQDLTQVCAGQPVTFTAHPSCGVPPYHYVWSPDGGNTLDTVYGSAVYVVHPQGNVIVGCTIIDTCGDAYITNDLNITVVPAPPANAGSDVYVCEGGIVTLGGTLGNPTTSNGASVVWSGSSPTVENWLNNKFSPNPQAIIPAGTVDSFFYVVKASDFSCFRTDTVWVHSLAKPTAIIDSSGATHFCANQSVTLLVQGTYAAYQWNTGSAAIAITASQPGQYFAIVTDTHGCKDTSNVITVTNVAVPTVHVFPDTLILFGDSVMLYTDINLASASVDSFTWFPSVNISCTSCTNPFAAPLLDQYYGVIVHSSGCTVSDSALIRVILPNNFYIPNAFTPNGDGNNDNFYLQSQSGVRVILFQVFDRWGEKVHEGNYPWDGNYRGKPVPGGVYVYIFKLGLYGEDRALFRKGSVTLIR